MAAMASLVAGIAHEINTPIGAISSVYDTLSRAVTKLRQVLADGSQEDKPRGKADAILQIISDASNVIRTGSERVTAIVQSLRSFAHLDQAELKSVNIHDGLEDTVGLLQHNLGTRIEVIWNLGDVDPIICYPGRLNQVFLCVMENAIDAIEEQGQIEISTWREGDELFVTIRDSGIGIPEENLSKIFQPAFTTKGPGIGTGLGLSICYQIVQEHKGRIEVQSKVGEGSTLTMVLSYGFTGFGLV